MANCTGSGLFISSTSPPSLILCDLVLCVRVLPLFYLPPPPLHASPPPSTLSKNLVGWDKEGGIYWG
jgi:hypothetical protein